MAEVVDCVVVGAGWTGLATAAALRAFGVRNFILLEATRWRTRHSGHALHEVRTWSSIES